MANVAGMALQFIGKRKEAKALKKQAKESRRAAALEARRARRRTIREARIQRGAALNIGAQVGARESSGLAGGLSGIAAQAGSNLGFSTQTEAIGRKISKLGDTAARARELQGFGLGIQQFSESLGRALTGGQ